LSARSWHRTSHRKVHTVRTEWLQVFTIVAALLGVVGLQSTWVSRLEARLE